MDYKIYLDNGHLFCEVPTKEIAEKIEQLYWELNATEIQYFWQSKYNTYVRYDYEPFCVDGFYIILKVRFRYLEQMKFAKFETEKLLNKLNDLEKLFEQEIDMRSKLGKRVKELQEV